MLNIFIYLFIYANDDVLKSLVSCRLQVAPMSTCEQEQNDQTEGTDVVPTKNPLKVKSVNEKSL